MSEFRDFIDLIYSIRDKEILEDFLLAITTPSEQKEFAQRVEIVKQLLSGKAQHDIAHELGVGVATVTRASKELAQGRFKILRYK